MTRGEIESKVREIMAEQFAVEVGEVDLEDEIEDFGADSLDLPEIVIDLEHRFDITVEDDAMDSWETVGSIVEYVAGRLA